MCNQVDLKGLKNQRGAKRNFSAVLFMRRAVACVRQVVPDFARDDRLQDPANILPRRRGDHPSSGVLRCEESPLEDSGYHVRNANTPF